jgi:hypothetical protein
MKHETLLGSAEITLCQVRIKTECLFGEVVEDSGDIDYMCQLGFLTRIGKTIRHEAKSIREEGSRSCSA